MHRLLLPILLALVVAPLSATAQPWAVNDPRGVVELGFVQEWFHRELEPSPYADTRWSTTSLVFDYHAADWLNLGFQGGIAEIESDDFPGSDYERYSVGAAIAARIYRRGNWTLSAHARYLDTFDLDSSENLLHKRVRSVGGSLNAARELALFGQSTSVWAGPTVVDDLVETFFWDSFDAVGSTTGAALGANAGARVILGWIAVHGFVSYVDDWQGGFGVSLHAKGGGF